jgi:hypothetical protein
MIVIGLLIAALLLPGPMLIAEGVGLDVHTLLVGSMSILVGVQTLTFGLMARSYAKRNGMIPRDSRYDKLIMGVRLEHMLGLSAFLLFCGFGGVGWAVRQWSAADFGALDYRNAMRTLIFAVTCVVGSLQLGFAAFLLGVMEIRHK